MAKTNPITEEWRDVVGYEGWYQVSNLGRVRNMKRRQRTQVGHILKPRPRNKTSYAYPAVVLSMGSTEKTCSVHILVITAFLGAPPPGKEVNHIDGNKSNPRLDNLEYLTKPENAQHAIRMGLKIAPRGTDNSQAKITDEIVREIRQEYAHGKASMLARRYGISPALVSKVGRGLGWRHVH